MSTLSENSFIPRNKLKNDMESKENNAVTDIPRQFAADCVYLIFRHAPCKDGDFCEAIIRKKVSEQENASPVQIEYLPLTHPVHLSTISQQIEIAKAKYALKDTAQQMVLFFLDICPWSEADILYKTFTPETQDIFFNKHWYILDHHISTIRFFDKIKARLDKPERFLTRAKLDVARCGATLCWNHFFAEERQQPLILTYIEDRDAYGCLRYGEETLCHTEYLYQNNVDQTTLQKLLHKDDNAAYAHMYTAGTNLKDAAFKTAQEILHHHSYVAALDTSILTSTKKEVIYILYVCYPEAYRWLLYILFLYRRHHHEETDKVQPSILMAYSPLLCQSDMFGTFSVSLRNLKEDAYDLNSLCNEIKMKRSDICVAGGGHQNAAACQFSCKQTLAKYRVHISNELSQGNDDTKPLFCL